MNHGDTREAIWHACTSNDVPQLAYRIETQFTDRLKKSYGSAYYKKKTIFLSRPLFRQASPIKQHECIVHMTCHLIVQYKWRKHEQYHPFPRLHGPEWKAALAATNVPNTLAYCFCPRAERISEHRFGCACRKDLRFSQQLAETVAKRGFICARCNNPVHLLPEVSHDLLLSTGA